MYLQKLSLSNFKNYYDSILLVDKGEKTVSSSLGHGLMDNHPFAKERFKQANNHISDIVAILKNGDLKKFIAIVESEALTLHAMMMTSNPYFILMKPNTLAIIEKIRAFREEQGVPACFTLDAGPNVHLIYPYQHKKEVNNFIESKLLVNCAQNFRIDDKAGQGPEKLTCQ